MPVGESNAGRSRFASSTACFTKRSSPVRAKADRKPPTKRMFISKTDTLDGYHVRAQHGRREQASRGARAHHITRARRTMFARKEFTAQSAAMLNSSVKFMISSVSSASIMVAPMGLLPKIGWSCPVRDNGLSSFRPHAYWRYPVQAVRIIWRGAARIRQRGPCVRALTAKRTSRTWA